MVRYVDEFSKLARYTSDDVATNAAKQEKLVQGLNDELVGNVVISKKSYAHTGSW